MQRKKVHVRRKKVYVRREKVYVRREKVYVRRDPCARQASREPFAQAAHLCQPNPKP